MKFRNSKNFQNQLTGMRGYERRVCHILVQHLLLGHRTISNKFLKAKDIFTIHIHFFSPWVSNTKMSTTNICFGYIKYLMEFQQIRKCVQGSIFFVRGASWAHGTTKFWFSRWFAGKNVNWMKNYLKNNITNDNSYAFSHPQKQ